MHAHRIMPCVIMPFAIMPCASHCASPVLMRHCPCARRRDQHAAGQPELGG